MPQIQDPAYLAERARTEGVYIPPDILAWQTPSEAGLGYGERAGPVLPPEPESVVGEEEEEVFADSFDSFDLFSTPGEVVYDLLHPSEPGPGLLTQEEVEALAQSEPSYVPGEGLFNIEGTGALDSLARGLRWLTENWRWAVPVGVVVYLVGPTVVAGMWSRR